MSEIPSREEVVNAWRAISNQGYGDPADIGELITGKPKTEEMLRAEYMFDAWYKSEEAKQTTPEEKLRFQFAATTVYLDAGFQGSQYLDEVANDWLAQDADDAEEQGFTELASQINAKIDDINNQLENS